MAPATPRKAAAILIRLSAVIGTQDRDWGVRSATGTEDTSLKVVAVA